MKLNENQQKAVDLDQPLIVVTASPGSGKTATLVASVKQAIKTRRVSPEKVAVFTFTISAAREFADRLKEAGVPKLGYIGTLHGWALRYGIEASKIATVIDGVAYKRIIDEELKRLAFADGLASKVKSALIEGKTLGGKGKLGMASIKKNLANKKICPLNDLIETATEILKENELGRNPDHKPFDAIYVDEYQDTSDGDHDCYQAMKAKYQFYVGDSDQSVYGFRGSNHENLDKLAIEASKQGCHVVLEKNYRSGKRICEFAQKIIGDIKNRVPKEMQAAKNITDFVNIQQYETDAEEISTIGKFIISQLEAGVEASQIAVLTRYNTDAIRIAEALRCGNNLPVSLPGQKNEQEKNKIDLAVEIVADPKSKSLKKWEEIYGEVPDNYDPLVIAGGNLEKALTIAGINSADATRIATVASQQPDRWTRKQESILRLRGAAKEHIAENTEQGNIQVITMHGSKGKEYQAVWIAHADSKALPDTDDSRRLAYVAATRAKRQLVVSSSKSKPDFTGKIESGLTPSPVYS